MNRPSIDYSQNELLQYLFSDKLRYGTTNFFFVTSGCTFSKSTVYVYCYFSTTSVKVTRFQTRFTGSIVMGLGLSGTQQIFKYMYIKSVYACTKPTSDMQLFTPFVWLGGCHFIQKGIQT